MTLLGRAAGEPRAAVCWIGSKKKTTMTGAATMTSPVPIQIMRKYGIAGTVMGGGLMFTQDELQAAGVLPQAGKP